MNIPNYLNTPPINPETGEWTPEWSNLMQQLFTQLQTGVGQEGFKPSPLVTSQITDLQLIAAASPGNAAVSTGSIYFDTTLNNNQAFKAMVNGNIYTFGLT